MTPLPTAVQKRMDALTCLGLEVVAQAARDRDARADSDLDDEQPVIVTMSTTLGDLRAAGLREYA